jgi:threonine dehydrogenase-like Zn-dependent dehydrogenase
MKALCWHGTGNVRVDTVPDPTIQDPRDVVIKITSTAICGSDLHLFDGFQPTMEKCDQLGHENIGEIVDVGSGISTLKVGDRVVVPFTGNSRCRVPGCSARDASSASTACASAYRWPRSTARRRRSTSTT